ncbi:MAG: aldehyde ferredoxin oxidoreductase family protein [Promethearchaeota archaeon]
MEKMIGYNGKIAFIDLKDDNISIKDLDPKIAEDYIGGVGLSAKLTYDLLTDSDYETLKKDPLSGINPLIFSTGPLTATATPSSSRYAVTGISPLTGIWGESTSGGFFPMALKRSGFDAIVIIGESETPKYIIIKEGKIELKDASNVWGKNTRETISTIKEELGEKTIRMACIGKAGENLVKYAAIINDEGRAAGRCGLGALMGKKKIKALAVKGSNKIELADKEVLKRTRKNAIQTIHNAFSTNFFSNHGTLCYTDMGMVIADIPSNYFTSTEFVAERITGHALKEQYPVIKYACSGCTIGCGRTTIAEIDGKEVEIDGPEYETVAAYGPLCGITDFDPILITNHICNLEGVDTISSGVSIAFLIYLVENNLAKEKIESFLKDIAIDEIKWGNHDLIVKLLNQIIKREGIGDLLAEGVRKMAEKLEIDPELAAHVKGLEIPMHDPRAYHGQALSYMTCCIGASHEKGDFFNIDGDAATFRKISKGDRFNINGREAAVAALQDMTNVFDSAVICNFPHISIATMTRFFKAATAFASLGNAKKMQKAGERGTTLKRVINCKLGITRQDDKLPKIVTKTLKSGGSAGIELNLEENLKAFYKARGWDWETGAPTKEKLEELGIL